MGKIAKIRQMVAELRQTARRQPVNLFPSIRQMAFDEWWIAVVKWMTPATVVLLAFAYALQMPLAVTRILVGIDWADAWQSIWAGPWWASLLLIVLLLPFVFTMLLVLACGSWAIWMMPAMALRDDRLYRETMVTALLLLVVSCIATPLLWQVEMTPPAALVPWIFNRSDKTLLDMVSAALWRPIFLVGMLALTATIAYGTRALRKKRAEKKQAAQRTVEVRCEVLNNGEPRVTVVDGDGTQREVLNGDEPRVIVLDDDGTQYEASDEPQVIVVEMSSDGPRPLTPDEADAMMAMMLMMSALSEAARMSEDMPEDIRRALMGDYDEQEKEE